MPINNPFGVNLIRNKVAVGNQSYPTLDDAIRAWENSKAGRAVRGISDPQTFVQALLNMHYNTVNPNYKGEFMGRYGDVGRAMGTCGVN